MSYDKMQKELNNIFNQRKQAFTDYANRKTRDTNIYEFIPNSQLELKICYPGKKTSINQYNKIIYDYRVDYYNIAFSHPTIITDLYNKILQYPEIYQELRSFLINVAYFGVDTDTELFSNINGLNFSSPSDELITYVNNIFRNLHKPYLSNSNYCENLTLFELKNVISWIALQEDINYPMSKNFQGRRMPFYRYLEAIYVAKYNNNQHNLDEVIERSVSHYRPRLWKELNYKEIENLINFDTIS